VVRRVCAPGLAQIDDEYRAHLREAVPMGPAPPTPGMVFQDLLTREENHVITSAALDVDAAVDQQAYELEPAHLEQPLVDFVGEGVRRLLLHVTFELPHDLDMLAWRCALANEAEAQHRSNILASLFRLEPGDPNNLARVLDQLA
jgi:hypothetical protein